jgi:hypothetical protein
MANGMTANVKALAGAPPADQEGLERERFDVRHIMRLQAEGKPFVTHFKDADLMKAPSSDEWCTASRLMLKYLHRMKSDTERELQTRLKTMPLDEALDNDQLVHYWDTDRRDFEAMACDWFAYADSHQSESGGFPTPAYYLLTHRPPVPFDFQRSRLWMLGWRLINHIVEGKDWPFSDCGLSQLQPKRAA